MAPFNDAGRADFQTESRSGTIAVTAKLGDWWRSSAQFREQGGMILVNPHGFGTRQRGHRHKPAQDHLVAQQILNDGSDVRIGVNVRRVKRALDVDGYHESLRADAQSILVFFIDEISLVAVEVFAEHLLNAIGREGIFDQQRAVFPEQLDRQFAADGRISPRSCSSAETRRVGGRPGRSA